MIITRLKGGMGNQMFQYALGRALSLRNNTTLGLDMYDLLDKTPRFGRITPRDYDLDVFNIQAGILSQSQIPFRYRSWGNNRIVVYLRIIFRKLYNRTGKEKKFTFDPNIFTIGPNAYLDGYWQSYKYFESISDIIRTDFTLRNPLSKEIQILQKEILETNSVALHVRRGDYVGNIFHNTLTKEYYDRALTALKEKVMIDHLYIFSDDIKWCEENLSFGYPATFVKQEYAGEKGEGHMALMSSCKHCIIANSSFSWWAAWLANSPNKIIIGPKQWFIDDSIDTGDLCPPGWIRI